MRTRRISLGQVGWLTSTPAESRGPRATPITPSWLCDCGRYNAPQRDACTECQSDKPKDAT